MLTSLTWLLGFHWLSWGNTILVEPDNQSGAAVIEVDSWSGISFWFT